MKNKKYLYEVEFLYFKGDEPAELRFTEGFYETEKSLNNVIDFTERLMIRLGYKLLSARIIKKS
jgi:hypothetical protein